MEGGFATLFGGWGIKAVNSRQIAAGRKDFKD
jgi:hypothetical protein